MADWIHCNKCIARYDPSQKAAIKFFLAECGHLFCHKCVERIKQTRKCIICSKSCTVVQLSKDTEPNIMQYFSPPEETLKKYMQIQQYQNKHRLNLVENLLRKYAVAKKEYMISHNANKRFMKENQMLRSQLRASGQNPQAFSTSTPKSTSSGNVTFNNSLGSSIQPPRVVHGGGPAPPPPRYYSRNELFSSASSQSSVAQRVPVHRMMGCATPRPGAMQSLDELMGRMKTHNPNMRN